MSKPVVFISYSHEDEEWEKRLISQLGALESENLLDIWDDRRIPIGEDWLPAILRAIRNANIAVLLVSAPFLNSKFIKKVEIPRLLQRRIKEGLRVIPLIVKPCAWKRISWLSRIQAWPKDGKALSTKNDAQIDSDLAELAEKIIEPTEITIEVDQIDTTPEHNNQDSHRIVDKIIDVLREAGYPLDPVGKSADEVNFEYLARRYGFGYRKLFLQCIIDRDGSAQVIRDVEIEAYSSVSEVDTIINIPEKDPDGLAREIEAGEIETEDYHDLKLTITSRKEGHMSAKVEINPPLIEGEKLKYRVFDYYLPKGLFAIDLSPEQYQKRENQNDYFGWHINRPTEKFSLQVIFPFGNRPAKFWAEVKYAASAGISSDQVPSEERRRIKKPEIVRGSPQDTILFTVDYPMSGMIYILGWKPKLKQS